MRATFRPLPAWPYPPMRRRPGTYRVTHARALQDLENEIEQLKGRDVLIGLVVDERDIRLDGGLRADANIQHAGVELSFEVPGPRRLVFHTDVHGGWHDNIRAIGLGLEALRAVARYGITTGVGEQYAGFAQLAPGGPDPERGRRLVEQAGGMREALRRHHPDQGGTMGDFIDVQAYRQLEGG